MIVRVLFVISKQINTIMKNKRSNVLIIFTFLLFSLMGKYQAQVISSNFSPEVTIDASSEPYAFDFNGDGVIEFYFLVQDLSGDTTIAGLPATYEGSGALLGCENGKPAGATSAETSAFDVSRLVAGDELTVFQEYGEDTSYAIGIDLIINTGVIGSLPYQYGAFRGEQGYLGAMFDIAGSLHLGWIEVSVLSDGSQITLHSYGYDASQSGDPLSVGNMNTNITEFTPQEVNVNINKNLLSIELSSFDSEGFFRIIDLSGKVRMDTKLSNLQNKYDLSTFESGIYIVSVEALGNVYVKKVILH